MYDLRLIGFQFSSSDNTQMVRRNMDQRMSAGNHLLEDSEHELKPGTTVHRDCNQGADKAAAPSPVLKLCCC